jgi:hypothetical protein
VANLKEPGINKASPNNHVLPDQTPSSTILAPLAGTTMIKKEVVMLHQTGAE